MSYLITSAFFLYQLSPSITLVAHVAVLSCTSKTIPSFKNSPFSHGVFLLQFPFLDFQSGSQHLSSILFADLGVKVEPADMESEPIGQINEKKRSIRYFSYLFLLSYYIIYHKDKCNFLPVSLMSSPSELAFEVPFPLTMSLPLQTAIYIPSLALKHLIHQHRISIIPFLYLV